MSSSIDNKIGKATGWSTITAVLSKLITPIINLILARLLTPGAFGIVATITMVISFAEVFTDAGFQKYIIQHEFQDEEELNKNTNVAFWTNLGLSTIICIIIFFFREQLAVLVGSPGLGNSISVASILIIVVAFSSIQTARCKRDFDFKTLFFVRIGSSLIPLLVTIPLAIVLKNYWAILIGNIASNLFTAIVLTLKSKWRPKFFYSFKIFKEMFSFSAWTLLESISIWLTVNIDIFIVGKFLDEHYLGLYKTSITTINSYMGIITSAILPVLFSTLSRYQNNENNFQKTYYTFQRIASIFVLPMGLGVFLFKDLVTQILFGPQWLEASSFIGLCGLTSAVIIIFSYFASEVYRSKGKPKISLLSQIIHLVFLIPILLISGKYGFKIICISKALGSIQLVLINLIIMRIIFKFSIKDGLKNIYPMVIATLIMGVAGYGLKLISNNMFWQLAAVLICIIVYFTVLFLLFPKIRREIFNFKFFEKIRNKFSRKKDNIGENETENKE